jgi:hypothetical protein
MHGEMRNAYKILAGKTEGKRLLGRPRCRWEDYTEMDLKYEGRVWTGFMWLRMRTIGEGM